MDSTENIRREMVYEINSQVITDDKETERKRLLETYDEVMNTSEVSEKYEILGFMAPFVVVRRKSDNKKGSLMFQHSPRFYFGFEEVKP